MKVYRITIALIVTLLMTLLLFLPIPTFEKEVPTPIQMKRATISLREAPPKPQPVAVEPMQTAETIEAVETSFSESAFDTPEDTAIAAAEAVTKKPPQEAHLSPIPTSGQQRQSMPMPMLMDGYYEVEAGVSAPTFDRALLASKVVYPPLARRQHKEGIVVLRLFIGIDGKIERIEVEEDPGFGLAEAAVAAFVSITAKPALFQGNPVAVTLRYPIRFALE